MMYFLSCEKEENGGGVYAYHLTENGTLEERGYFACDRPMYALKCEKGLCVLLRQPFADSEFSGYFFIGNDLKTATEIKSTQGKVACHLAVDGDAVYTVNYLSGNLVKNGTHIAQREGKSVHSTRQTEPHTHFVCKTPDGYFAVCDLGTDTLAIYDCDLRLFSEAKVPDGYGIRHLIFSNDGKFIYAVNELVPSVSVFTYKKGKAKLVETIKIDCQHEKANGAAIRLSKDGKTLYASVREENAVAVYKVNGAALTHLQTLPCGGDSPRDIEVCEDYLVCANERSGNVTVYDLKKGVFTAELALKNALCCVK